LLVKSFIRLNNVNPGFDLSDVVAARVRLTPSRYAGGPAQTQFFDQLLASLQSRPGVQSASLAAVLPLSGAFRFLMFDPRTVRPDYPQPFMMLRSFAVSPDYFASIRMPIRLGRPFTTEDRAGAPAVAIVNRATVKELWPDQSPVGKQINLGRGVMTIVG